MCEAFRLKRETFYLTVDFIDRYLSRVRDVSKPQLQLIGITALFIATKVEVRGVQSLVNVKLKINCNPKEEDVVKLLFQDGICVQRVLFSH